MQVQLSQKEQMLLKDLKGHEELCVEKYSKYAKEAECANLSQMFQNLLPVNSSIIIPSARS